jgi:hypothetical protein
METQIAPGWYPLPDQANTLRYFDGKQKTDQTVPAPGQDALDQIARDVHTIKIAALTWLTLTIIGLCFAAAFAILAVVE